MPINKEILKAASGSIKQTLTTSTWWKYVQPDVEDGIHLVLDNLETIAIPFRDSFVHVFRFEHCRRMIEDKSVESKIPGALFGKELPEEVYQSGKLPVKMLLRLNDWIEPNEADVQACLHIITQIDVFATLGAFGSNLNTSTDSYDFFPENDSKLNIEP